VLWGITLLQKGKKWSPQYHRLAKLMRQFYISVAVPKMPYTTDLFIIPENRYTKGKKGYINKLGWVQRQASLHITGAMKSAPTDTVDVCADLPFHLLVDKITHLQ